MSVREISQIGDPVLERVADAVADPTAPEIAALVADMVESMRAAGGIGIAAPQVGVSLRVVLFFLPPARDDTGPGVPLTVLVNPVIEPLDDERVTDWEGCLSVPERRGQVSRARRIRYRGTTPEGETIDRIAEGWHARVVQHECDHLDGVLYPERMGEADEMIDMAEWQARNAPPQPPPADAPVAANVERA
jgi:peptide deformylase